ncbi:MAG TPA: metal-dependent hydrolase [Bryobacteraceae bacterium]|jgi:inner membrane protein
MDNLTHSLTGLALSRAGLDRFSPRAVWLLVLSANAPDSDIVVATRGAFPYFEAHRGYTHSFIGLPFMAALVVLVVAAVSRTRLPWLRAWILCLIGVGSHLLLDATNSYGIRLLLPFSSRWSHLDLNGLYDIWILLALLFAALWPLFAGLVTREIGAKSSSAGRTLAIAALVFFAAFDLLRLTMHNRVVAQLESHLYEDLPPLNAAALPDSFNPLRWTAVVETADTYELSSTRPFGEFASGNPAIFYKPPVTHALDAVRAIEPFRYFLYFARFPVWSVQTITAESTRGTRLDLTDLRFGVPGAGSFHCIAYLDARDQVAGKWYTFGSGSPLGWGASR